MNSKVNVTKTKLETTELLNQKLTDAMMAALKTVHSAASPDSTDLEDLAFQRKGQEVLGRLMSPPIGFSWEPFSLDEMPMAWVRPERGHDRSKVILYCHGGGYTSGNLGYARVLAAKMASATGCEVLAFQYRLAPEFPYPAALEDALAAWEYLMHQGWGARDIILAGDSAGGNLALELTLALKEQGRFLPGRLVLFSPWTDMTASGDSYTQREELDPMLTNRYIQSVRSAYAPDADYSQPCFSPLFGDLTGFPPTLVQVGEREILYRTSTWSPWARSSLTPSSSAFCCMRCLSFCAQGCAGAPIAAIRSRGGSCRKLTCSSVQKVKIGTAASSRHGP